MRSRLAPLGSVALASVVWLGVGCGGGDGGGNEGRLSRLWTWSGCGSISPAPADTAAAFSPDGRILVVRDETGAVRVYDAAAAGPPTAVGSGTIVFVPDTSALRLANRVDRSIVLSDPSGAAPASTFTFPSNLDCASDAVAFSPDGRYLLAHAGGPTCIWRASDQSLVAGFVEYAAQAAIRGDTLVMLQLTTTGQTEAVTRDFSGQDLSRTPLTLDPDPAVLATLVLSPAGDRVAYGSFDRIPPARLFDAATGGVIATFDCCMVPNPIFTPAGDRLLLGDGMIDARDGSRVAPSLASGATWPNRVDEALALAPGGGSTAMLSLGRAEVRETTALDIVAVLGPPVHATDRPPSSVTISAGGNLLVIQTFGAEAYGFRVAPQFAASATLWSITGGGETTTSDVSADGSLVTIAGDGRLLYGGRSGRALSSQPAAPDRPPCYRQQLRISPSGKWAAGAGYLETMDLFSTGGGALWQQIGALPSGCSDAAAFSRDEGLMATSTPALFRTADATADWQQIWTKPTTQGAAPVDTVSLWANDVRFSPDEKQLLVSHCRDWTCDVNLFSVRDGTLTRKLPQLTAPHPSFSPDGDWVVSGGTLLHLPSGDVRPLDATTTTSVATFTPNGDIIGASTDYVLTRYCRNQ